MEKPAKKTAKRGKKAEEAEVEEEKEVVVAPKVSFLCMPVYVCASV